MKILFVLEYYPPYLGGVEKLFALLTSALAREGHQVVVLTADYSGNLPPREEKNGVEVHRIRVRNRFLFTLQCLPLALRLAKSADLIHTTSYNAGFPSFLVGLLRRKKVLITFHEYWGKNWFHLPFLKTHERWLFFLYERLLSILPFHQVVAVSDFTAKRLKEAAGMKRVVRIYNGMIPKSSQQNHEQPGTTPHSFLFVGRLGVSKGIDILVNSAVEYLRTNDARFTFIVAKQPLFMLEFIRSAFQARGLQEKLTILHEVDDEELVARMKSATAVVVPSYSEGFGFVAAEACALDVPVIHSGRGSLNEVVSGKTIEMKSYTASDLKNALEDAAAGRFTVSPKKMFAMEATTEAYTEAYRRLINP